MKVCKYSLQVLSHILMPSITPKKFFKITWPRRDLTRLFLKSVSIPDCWSGFGLELFKLRVFSRAAANESLLSSWLLLEVEASEVVETSGTGEPVLVEGDEASENNDKMFLGQFCYL